MWSEVVKSLGGQAILIAAVAWLIRSIIVHLLNKDVATFKAELQKQVLEHNVRFRRVDEKIAEHLSQLYAHLFRLYEAVVSYVQIVEHGDAPSKEEKLNLVNGANTELNGFMFPNRLYIPPHLYQQTKKCAQELADIANKFTRGLRRERQGRGSGDEDTWSEALKRVEEIATPLFSEIVEAFQKRIGVDDETKCPEAESSNL